MRRAGMACDRATRRKYMLKKKENSLYRVTGRNDRAVYFALDTVFGGKEVVRAAPTAMVLADDGSSSSWSAPSSASRFSALVADIKLGNRRPLVSPRIRSDANERRRLAAPYSG